MRRVEVRMMFVVWVIEHIVTAGVYNGDTEPFGESRLPVRTPISMGEIAYEKAGKPNAHAQLIIDEPCALTLVQPLQLEASELDLRNEVVAHERIRLRITVLGDSDELAVSASAEPVISYLPQHGQATAEVSGTDPCGTFPIGLSQKGHLLPVWVCMAVSRAASGGASIVVRRWSPLQVTVHGLEVLGATLAGPLFYGGNATDFGSNFPSRTGLP